MAENATKKAELKEPDPFLRFTIELWDRIHAHRKELGIGLAVLLVAAMVFAGVQAHQENARAEAGAALGQALRIASRPVKGEDAEPEEKPASPDDAPFKTDQEKQTALAAALKDVIAKHPGTEAARDAELALGDAQLKLGQLDDAQKSYQGFVQAGSDDPQLRALAELGLAKIAEIKKDYAGAAAAYETLQRDAPHQFLKDRAALGKARMLELSGKKQEAAAAYQEVKTGFTGTDAAREAAERLASLESQGFKAPAPPAPAPGAQPAPMPPKAE